MLYYNTVPGNTTAVVLDVVGLLCQKMKPTRARSIQRTPQCLCGCKSYDAFTAACIVPVWTPILSVIVVVVVVWLLF